MYVSYVCMYVYTYIYTYMYIYLASFGFHCKSIRTLCILILIVVKLMNTSHVDVVVDDDNQATFIVLFAISITINLLICIVIVMCYLRRIYGK